MFTVRKFLLLAVLFFVLIAAWATYAWRRNASHHLTDENGVDMYAPFYDEEGSHDVLKSLNYEAHEEAADDEHGDNQPTHHAPAMDSDDTSKSSDYIVIPKHDEGH
ncbi:MAG: hypothetical protein M3Q97_11745 [Bacteroidota bacterium]|nr:hypothetical protein [Bacteroidota bacterium]